MYGIMVLLYSGIWYCGIIIMVLLYYGIMVLLYFGIMILWYYDVYGFYSFRAQTA